MSIKKNISTNADFSILVIRNLQIKQVFYWRKLERNKEKNDLE